MTHDKIKEALENAYQKDLAKYLECKAKLEMIMGRVITLETARELYKSMKGIFAFTEIRVEKEVSVVIVTDGLNGQDFGEQIVFMVNGLKNDGRLAMSKIA
jgi:hypothetical protein